MSDHKPPADWMAKTTKLNTAGVKNSADMYRTFNGAHYPHWAIDPSPDYVKRLRAAGVRCRRVGVELFIHHEDYAKAVVIGDPGQ